MDHCRTEECGASKDESQLIASVGSLFGDEEYSDLTITCGPHTFRVHKAIVCPRSDYFKAACRKGRFKEGEENIINLEASDPDPEVDSVGTDNPDAIAYMMHYLYQLNYTVKPIVVNSIEQPEHEQDPNGTERLSPRAKFPSPHDTQHQEPPGVHEDDRSLCMHAKVFAAAVKYGVDGLRALAVANFQNTLGGVLLGKVSITDIAEAIPIVYASTATSVRDLRQIMEYALLNSSTGLLQKDRITASIDSVKNLALELLVMSRGGLQLRASPCFKCRHGDLYECNVCGSFYSTCSRCISYGLRRYDFDCFKCNGTLTYRGDVVQSKAPA